MFEIDAPALRSAPDDLTAPGRQPAETSHRGAGIPLDQVVALSASGRSVRLFTAPGELDHLPPRHPESCAETPLGTVSDR